MNTAQLSKYAPAARRAFINAVSAQAAQLGITKNGIIAAVVKGDVLVIGDQFHPAAIAKARENLADRVQAKGFTPTMEAIAYTWFNRFVAIRYMEIHGYLDHGFRVLSQADGNDHPEILDHAADVALPGLDRKKATELKLDGTQDEALYRLLLLAQCNALHQAMPFLFEKIGDETELLLPANLLHTDSLIRQLVEQVDEALWQEIEIIGWLYQFYISEKKDQVIGKVVKSEDIPAATQLFTPNWIVKYMVQNSLGAQWLATYPQSPLKGQMEYYIEPAEQTDEVKAQLAAITPSQLNPAELTLIDPASGSGHILVEAYELFKAIYLERGYRQRDVPQLILEKNLFGLDIDERAAQLTGFALMMKGRADDRRLFERGVKLNVMALVDSVGFDVEALAKKLELGDYGLKPGDLTELKRLFEYATTFGSLIQVPEGLAEKLPALRQLSEAASQDLFVLDALDRLAPLVQQAVLLAAQYDVAVANPPYMGVRLMPKQLKVWIKVAFPSGRANTFAAFMLRCVEFSRTDSKLALVTLQNWMFLSSFEEMREELLSKYCLRNLVQIGFNSFPELNSKVALASVFVFTKSRVPLYRASYVDCNSAPKSANKEDVFKQQSANDVIVRSTEDYLAIPGSPVAYWIPGGLLSMFRNSPPLGEYVDPRQGLATSDNERFLRLWYEVDLEKTGFAVSSTREAEESGKKWFPYNKGSGFRRWYAESEYVINWEAGGKEVIDFASSLYGSASRTIKNQSFYFRGGVTWTDISLSISARWLPKGHVFDTAGPVAFASTDSHLWFALAFGNSSTCSALRPILNPTLHFTLGDFRNLPFPTKAFDRWTKEPYCAAVEIARVDCESYELSGSFARSPLLQSHQELKTLEAAVMDRAAICEETRDKLARIEETNNRLFIDAYGLGEELTPDVPLSQITLTVNPAYRYGGKLAIDAQWTRFRQDTLEELVSYAIGNMMGRYSLDAPGLIYAHSGNEGFDPSRYPTFPADDDGIVPLTDTEWFDDDACHRLVEFISVALDKNHLEDNLSFLADNLSRKKGESGRETLRRYLCDKFFKDHLQTYKKRPIYWLFSSGKQKAFQCLVYLHRYNEGTLSRMRSEYVIPLQGKIAARIEKLQGDIQKASSTAQSKRLEKELAKLIKQQVELLAFDEKLRHYADRRISLDLDDGVKVNYGKFGDLLAEVVAVHGKKAESA